VVTLVHELPGIIHQQRLEPAARDVVEHSDAVVFAGELVRTEFEAIGGELGARAHVRPQGLYKRPRPPESAARARAARSDVAFVWLGCEDRTLVDRALGDARALGFEGSLRLMPRDGDVARFYAAADLLLLPSREDPFPSVILEALSYGLPVVAFEGATGASELLRRGCGELAPYLDVDAMAAVVLDLLGDRGRRVAMGTAGQGIVADEFDWRDYLHFVLGLAGLTFHRVSVVVPNYNYARYLPERLASVFGQTYPVREVIVLDDASGDGSLRVLDGLRNERGWEFEVLPNEVNSGSVFRQWQRGVERARGSRRPTTSPTPSSWSTWRGPSTVAGWPSRMPNRASSTRTAR
jgi:hypothetical protein